MASTVKDQALFEAPVEEVWELLADPSRYAEWAADAIEVTGIPTAIEKGSSFEVKGPGPLGSTVTTTYKIEELEDMREIKLRCQMSGYYSRWVLTEARGDTFAEVETGVDPIGVPGRFKQLVETKRSMRRAAQSSLDGIRRLLGPA